MFSSVMESVVMCTLTRCWFAVDAVDAAPAAVFAVGAVVVVIWAVGAEPCICGIPGTRNRQKPRIREDAMLGVPARTRCQRATLTRS